MGTDIIFGGMTYKAKVFTNQTEYVCFRGRLHGRVVPAKRVTRFAELTCFVYLFPIILTLRLHGKRVVPLSRDPACGLPRNSLRRDENCHVITFCRVGPARRGKKYDSRMRYSVCLHVLFIMAYRNNSTVKKNS